MITIEERKIWSTYLTKKGLLSDLELNNPDKVETLILALVTTYGSNISHNPYHDLYKTICTKYGINDKSAELAVFKACDQVFDDNLIKEFIKIIWLK